MKKHILILLFLNIFVSLYAGNPTYDWTGNDEQGWSVKFTATSIERIDNNKDELWYSGNISYSNLSVKDGKVGRSFKKQNEKITDSSFSFTIHSNPIIGKARNTKCSVTLRKDDTPPTIESIYLTTTDGFISKKGKTGKSDNIKNGDTILINTNKIYFDISAKDSGIGVDKILIVANDKTCSSSDSFSLDENGNEFKVYAKDVLGNTSETIKFTVFVDTKPPKIDVNSFTITPEPKKYSQTVKVVPVASDSGSKINEDSWEYRIGEENWKKGKEVNVTTENATVYFKVEDNIGNPAEVKNIQVSNVDRTGPTINDFSFNPTKETYAKSVTVTPSATDNHVNVDEDSWEYSFTGKDGVFKKGKEAVVTTENGYVYFRVKDSLGNLSEVENIQVSNVDRTGPIINDFSLNPTKETYAKSVTVTPSATDNHVNVDEDSWEYSFTGKDGVFKKGKEAVVTTEDGYVYFRVKDSLGNLSEVKKIQVSNVDRTGPSITYENFNNIWKKATLNIEIKANDSNATVDNKSWKYKKWSNLEEEPKEWTEIDSDKIKEGEKGKENRYNVIFDKQGKYNLKIQVADKLGNVSEDTLGLIKIDTENPIIKFYDESNKEIINEETEWIKDKATIHVKATDIDGSGVNDDSWQISTKTGTSLTKIDVTETNKINYTFAEEGEWNFKVYVKDNVGHEKVGTKKIKIDTKAPEIIVNYINHDKWINSAAEVKVTAIDNFSGVDYRSWKYTVDGGKTWNDLNSNEDESGNKSTASITLNEDGIYKVRFSVKDMLGHENVLETDTIVKIDTVAPEITQCYKEKVGLPDNDKIIDSDVYYKENVKIKLKAKDVKKETISNISDIDDWYYEIRKDGFKIDDIEEIEIDENDERIKSDKENGIYNYILLFKDAGKYEVNVFVKDLAGNETKCNVGNIFIDKESPKITGIANQKEFNRGELTLEILAEDNYDGKDDFSYFCSFEVNGNPSNVIATGNNFNFKTEGKYTNVYFIITDRAGNSSKQKDLNKPFYIDNTKPENISFTDSFEVYYNSEKIDSNKFNALDELTRTSSLYFQNQRIEARGTDANPGICSGINEDTYTVSYKRKFNDEEIEIEDYNSDKIENGTKSSLFLNEEGLYTDIYFRVKDNSGNVSDRFYVTQGDKNRTIIIDKTKPQFIYQNKLQNAALMFYDDKEVIDGESIGSEKLAPFYIQMYAEDFYDGDKTGEIKGYIYYISNSKILDINSIDVNCWSIAENVKEENDEYNINKLTNFNFFENQSNYIYIKVVDAAGNISDETVEKHIIVDTGYPQVPEFVNGSISFTDNALSAYNLNTGNFIVNVTETPKTGIRGYKYFITKNKSIKNNEGFVDLSLLEPGDFLLAGETQTDSSECNIDVSELYFADPLTNDYKIQEDRYGNKLKAVDGLADNLAGEFYYITVVVIGGNGLVGRAAERKFRIDTTPPTKLSISVSPQNNTYNANSDSNFYYKSEKATVTWNKPADMTGVSRYEMYLYIDNVEIEGSPYIYKNEVGIESEDGNNTLSLISEDINIKKLFDNSLQKFGVVTIEVFAFDFAENSTKETLSDSSTDRYSFYADFTAPYITNDELEISFTEDDYTSATLNWGEAVDLGSGIKNIEIEYDKYYSVYEDNSSFDANSKRIVSTKEFNKEYVLSALDLNCAYYLTLKIEDKAENEYIINKKFQTGNFTVPENFENLEIEINDIYRGLEITGTAKFKIGNEEDAILTDGTITVPEDILITEILSDGTEVSVNKFNLQDDASYSNWKLQSAIIKTTEGSKYRTRVNNTTFINNGFVYNDINGFVATDVSYNISTSENTNVIHFDEVNLGFGDYTNLISNTFYSDKELVIDTNGIDIEGVSTIQLENTKINYNNSFFTSEIIDLRYRNILSREEILNKTEIQNVKTNLFCNSPSASVILKDGYNLILTLNGNTEYKVLAAGINGSKFTVYEAEVLLPEEYEPNILKVRNFSIDCFTGNVICENDFKVDNLTIKENGKNIINKGIIQLNAYGELLLTGTIKFSEYYDSVIINDLLITNNGADMENGGTILSYGLTLFGFTINVNNAKYKKNELLITNGIYTQFGVDFIISNLRIDTRSADTVYEECLIKGSCEAGANKSYGKVATINDIVISFDGFYINSLTVPVYGSSKETIWNFERIHIENNGTYQAASKQNFITEIGGFELIAIDTIFNGRELILKDCKISSQIASNFNTTEVHLLDVKLNASGIIDGGNGKENYYYSFDGWKGEFKKISISEEGLKGKILFKGKNKELKSSWYLIYDNFTLNNSGTIESGVISQDELENIVINDDFCFRLNDAIFEKNIETNKYELTSKNPIITIPYEEENCLEFESLVVNSDGVISNKKESKKIMNFTSANGYSVEASSFKYEDGKIIISGKIAPDGWNRIVPSKNIILYPDFTVEVAKTNDTINYNYADWNITGTGIEFGRKYLTIYSNKVKFKGVELELGEIVYYSRGEIVKQVVRAQNSNVQILSNRSVIKETRFSEDGLNTSMKIVLPEVFGYRSMDFNTVKLYQNDTFFTNINIKHKEINLDFMKCDFNYLTLTERGLSIEEAYINFPELEDLKISLEGLSISNNGNIVLDGASTSPFKLFNMIFCVSDLTFKNNELGINGTIILPEEMPGILSGRTVGIRSFKICLNDGKIRELDARLEGDFIIPFIESWELSLTSVGVTYENNSPGIVLDQAKVIVPSGYGIESLEIDKVALKYANKSFDFDFDKIQANLNLSTDISGITFSLNKVFITSSKTIGFGGSAYFGSTDFPDFLYDKSVKLNTFEIKGNGELGTIDIALDGLNGRIAPNIDVLELKDGSVKVKKQDETNQLFVSVSGSLQFTNKAIPELRGVALRLENFEIDTSKPVITELKAYISKEVNGKWSKIPSEINYDPVLFNTKFNDVFIAFEYDGLNKTGEVTLSGGLILPSTLPEGIANTEVRLEIFKIGLDGKIKDFKASYAIDKSSIGAVDLSNVNLIAEYKNEILEYDIGCTLTLSEEKFPEGIGGTSTSARFIFTPNELKYVDCSCNIPDQKLMNSLEMNGVKLSFNKTQGTGMSVSLEGSLKLPSTFPQGLAGTVLKINKLTMKTDGTFDVVDIAATNINANIFNQLKLNSGSIGFNKGTGHEFIISIGGKLSFISKSLPENLRNTTFGIDELKLSTSRGLLSFSAGLSGNVSIEVLGGVKLTLSKLYFTEKNFTISATAGLDFKAVQFVTNPSFTATVTMDWNGNITNFNGGLDSVGVKLCGFTGTINKLYVDRPTPSDPLMVTLGECRIEMPSNMGSMGGKSIALKNATFNPKTGAFNGDIELPKIETTLVGFTLVMDGPSLNFSSNSIGFTSVSLKLPDFLGNANVSLTNVTISKADGLKFGGGAFTLPDFAVGEVGFKNVGAEFSLDGKNYYISGHGGASIPGAGTLEAALSFTNKSEMYPIGIERAFFSFEVATGGIPLGSTGLYLSGIRGGLAYGPPKEVPSTYQGLFGENGIRIQLGLTVKDQTGGSMARVLADTWIDVTKLAWAFQGDATILSGTLNLNAYVYAALTKNVFATGMKVQILFVRGKIEIYIFGLDGKVKFSGCGEVSFGMPKGYLHDGALIQVPWDDIWLGGFGAMFGDFTNGKRGFLGYIDINIGDFNLGRVGAFVGTGGLDIKVKNYDILRPEGISFNQKSVREPVVRIQERNKVITEKVNTYQLVIPNEKPNTFVPVSSLNANVVNDGIPVVQEPLEDIGGGPSKTIFILAFDEGDPDFILYSPSGKEYRAGDKNVKTEYIENGILIDVDSPETGNWTIKVENLEEGQFELVTLGVEEPVKGTIESPADGIFTVTDKMYVKGTVTTSNTPVYIYASEDELSPLFSVGSVMADENGVYEGYVSTENLYEGDYKLSARILDSDGFESEAVFSTGKYRVNRSSLELNIPEKLRINEISKQKVMIVWKNTNGSRTAGYIVKSVNKTTGVEEEINTGNITELIIPYFPDKTELEYSVCAYDSYGNRSDFTEPLSIIVGGDKSSYNIPKVVDKVIEINVERGSGNTTELAVRYENWSEEETFIKAFVKQEENTNKNLTKEEIDALSKTREEYFIDINFDKNIKAERKGNNLEINIFAAENCAPGKYSYDCYVINENNYNSRSDFKIIVNVTNPKVKLMRLVPKTLDGTVENELTVYGSGFVSGSKFYLDDQELVVQENETNGLGTKTLVISEISNRGIHKLIAEGADGDRQSLDLNVLIPDYDINLYMTSVKVMAGNKAEFAVSATGFEGYKGKAIFKEVDVPEGLKVTLPVLSMNELKYITVETESGLATGKYDINLITGNGNPFTLTIYVTTDVVEPCITSVDPARLYKGLESTIYGYGFGSNGDLFLSNKIVNVTSWSDKAISFIVPESEKTGNSSIYVTNENGRSNRFSCKIYDNGYSLRVMKDDVEINAAESQTISVALTGYAENIQLSITKEPESPFVAELSKDSVSTNAVVDLVITCDEYATPGTYQLTINSVSGNRRIEKTIKVHVKSLFEITTKRIPTAYLGVPYSVQLENSEPDAEVIWNVEQGTLPLGLSLSGKGIINGTPEVEKASTVTISAKKLNGVKASKTFSIVIGDDIWATENKNAGLINSVVSEVPSNDQTEWIKDNGSDVVNLYTQGTRIIALSDKDVTTYDSNGSYQWMSSQKYKQSFITKDVFFGLNRENTLEAKSLITGLNIWERKNVTSMISNGTILITKESGLYYRIDINAGSISEKLTKGFSNVNQVIWVENNAYEWKKNNLIPIYGKEKGYTSGSSIYKIAADDEGFVLLTAKKIIILDKELNVLNELETVNTKESLLSLTKDEIYIQNYETVVKYQRENLDVLWFAKGGNRIIAANEKLIITDDEGLRILNGYTGKEIWKTEGTYNSVAIYKQNLYAANGENIISYNGHYNATAPETRILLNIEEPDGNNGWYRTIPEITVEAEDKETYVDSIKVNHNSTGWKKYENSFKAVEGYNIVEAYSLDSKQLKSEDVEKVFKVDVTKPVTNFVSSVPLNTNGWYDESIYLHLDATDNLSGVDHIKTNKGEYDGAISFVDEGEYTFKWQAVDKAGNMEDLKSVTIRIDKYAPVTQATLKSDKGITVVTVSAWDSCSGIAYTEYSINNGEVKQYTKPVVLMDEGWHNFAWRTFDISGKSSDWQSMDVYVQKDNSEGNVLALAELNGEREAIEYPLDKSSTLFVNNFTGNASVDKVTIKDYDKCYINFWSYNTMQEIPMFVLNSEYIKWKSSDMILKGKKTIQYYLKKDAIMYMFASPDMEVSEKWHLIEENVCIQNVWCKEGWKLYMRRANAEDCIEIEIQDGIDVLPIIAVKERPEITSELKITRQENWDDIYYEGRKPYRPGVKLNISVEENSDDADSVLPLQRIWTVELNGQEKPLVSTLYSIPEVKEDSKLIFRYKVIAADGEIESIAIKTIIVNPGDDPETVYPWNVGVENESN